MNILLFLIILLADIALIFFSLVFSLILVVIRQFMPVDALILFTDRMGKFGRQTLPHQKP